MTVFLVCHIADIFFAMHAGAKKLNCLLWFRELNIPRSKSRHKSAHHCEACDTMEGMLFARPFQTKKQPESDQRTNGFAEKLQLHRDQISSSGFRNFWLERRVIPHFCN